VALTRPSGLILLSPKYKAQEKVVTLPDGRRVRVTVDDSGTTRHIEENDRLHAQVRPRTTTIKIMRGGRDGQH
jgi:hypothetical protein